MDTIFDTPAIDLLSYEDDDCTPVYYWTEYQSPQDDDCTPYPAYFC